jgi:hypothetical protein
VGPWVIGIRGAPDVAAAATALEPLAAAVAQFPLPDDEDASGHADAPAPEAEEDYADEY